MTAQLAPQETVAAEGPLTVPALFQQTAARRGDAPALQFRAGSRWAPISWRDYAAAVARLGNALLEDGVAAGDRVAIWASNRPEWQIADLGITHVGAVTVAVYPTLAPAQVQYLLAHSETRVAIVEGRAQFDQLAGMRAELPALHRVVMLEGQAAELEGWLRSWDAYLRSGEAYARSRPGLLRARWQAIKPDDMASLIYTSGTTGTPKAAILTHRNLTWTVNATMAAHAGSENDRLLSYLPLAHVLERVVSHLRQLQTGCQVYFCPSVDQVMVLTREVHPTYMTSVPRLWEKIYAGVRGRMDEVRGPRRVIRDFALRAGALRTQAYEQGSAPSALLAWQWALADRLVFRNIRRALGLDAARVCISGSAAISPDILRFFYGLGIEILEGYGLTETTAPATVNRPGHARFGTVGPPLPGVEIKIAPDGEILIRGESVFAGYFKDPKATAEAFSDGFLLTGDIGTLDEDGFLRITDRKKDLFKTSGGKYIAPGAIENGLNGKRGIAQAVVLGDGRPFVAALITLDPDLPAVRGGPDDPAVQRLVDGAIRDVNQGLSHPEQIKKWKILGSSFLVGDELTPTMKVKRKVIAEKYRSVIEELYAGH
ncbi:MAG TPA: long-chain fatty acid--CoA ligase [Candidatus Limnocylindrales bacterium]|nr:long-chain fatty acid--CoA ligase [Candidatus Limnocylindrales bacterium]